MAGSGAVSYTHLDVYKRQDQELAQFQSAAVSYDYSNIVDLINLTFSCQEVTVITDRCV